MPPPPPTALHPAQAPDALAIRDLRDDLARWQARIGVRQWAPGEVGAHEIAEQIESGQWWVLHQGHDLVATVRLLTRDPLIWPDPLVEATYVHGLMVARSASGHGLGAGVLAWVEATAAARQHTSVRLDCVSGNHRLRAFYQQRGYAQRGQVSFGPDSTWHPVTRYEKPLH
ncbi:GNAT family N-acetyltransferase [Nocardiopsis nanhaiensis]